MRLVSILTASLLVAAFAAMGTAAPVTKMDDAAETRFVLFVLEECFRDTWPGIETFKEKMTDAQMKEVQKAADNATYPPTVRAFIAQRERVIQDVTARVREAKLGGKHNKELIEALELYLNLVRDQGEKHAKDLDMCMDHIKDKYVDNCRKANLNTALSRFSGAAEMTSWSMSYLDGTRDPLDALAGVLVLGMISEAKTRIQINGIRKYFGADFTNYLKGEGKREYLKKAKPVVAAFVKRFGKDLGEHQEKARFLAQTIADERKWKARETPFAAVKLEKRLYDVFAQLRRIDATLVTIDRGDTREANDRMEKAKKFMKAAEDVPHVKERGYNYFRALCYSEAGREANRAAVLLGGSGGFSARKPNDASNLALLAWNQFNINNDRVLTGEILHNYARGLVYNGKLNEAYRLIKKVKPMLWPPDSAFYYDLARIAALAPEDMLKSPLFPPEEKPRMIALMLQDSSCAMERAVCLGFTDFQRARVTADLQTLREARPETLKKYRTFDQIVADVLSLDQDDKDKDKKTSAMPNIAPTTWPPDKPPREPPPPSGSESVRLARELARAPAAQKERVLDKLREGKGVVYTEALAFAIPQLNGDTQGKAREALAERLTRMKTVTLLGYLKDEDREIRRAAALACAIKETKEAIPSLFPLLDDSEKLVNRAAHLALKELTGQTLEPNRELWQAWWDKQKKN